MKLLVFSSLYPYVEDIATLYHKYNIYLYLSTTLIVTYSLIRKIVEETQLKYKNQISLIISIIISTSIYIFLKSIISHIFYILFILSMFLAAYYINVIFTFLILIISLLFFIIFKNIPYSINIFTATMLYSLCFIVLYKVSLRKHIYKYFIYDSLLQKIKEITLISISNIFLGIIIYFLVSKFNSPNQYLFISLLLVNILYGSFTILSYYLESIIQNMFIQKNVEEKKNILENKLENLRKLKEEIEKQPFNNEEIISKINIEINRIQKQLEELKNQK